MSYLLTLIKYTEFCLFFLLWFGIFSFIFIIFIFLIRLQIRLNITDINSPIYLKRDIGIVLSKQVKTWIGIVLNFILFNF